MKSPSWASIVLETGSLRAHSFTAHDRFTDIMVHTICYMLVFSPIITLILSQFPDVITVQEGDLSPALSWAASVLLACLGGLFLYEYRAAPVERIFSYDAETKAFETTAFSRKGALVSRATFAAADVQEMFLRDDEGSRRKKQTHPSIEVSLEVVAAKKRHTLLCGREAEIWPLYQRMLDVLPNATR